MNKSFTLIEILVVIVVIGILSSFILVGMSSITNSANIAKSQAFVNSMDNSLLLGRVSQWKLDNASGTSASDSWLGNTGTLTNFANTTAGYGDTTSSGWMSQSNCVSGTCLNFDGSNDYVLVNAADSLKNTTFSFSCWIKPRTGIITSGHIVRRGADYYFRIVDNYTIRGFVWAVTHAESQSTNVVALNIWQNVVMIYNNTGDRKIHIYLNGLEVSYSSQIAAMGTMVNSNVSTFIGIDDSLSAGHWFPGSIDDVRIYNQVLSSSEINQNYFLGINNLFKNNGISSKEYDRSLVQLKNNLANN